MGDVANKHGGKTNHVMYFFIVVFSSVNYENRYPFIYSFMDKEPISKGFPMKLCQFSRSPDLANDEKLFIDDSGHGR